MMLFSEFINIRKHILFPQIKYKYFTCWSPVLLLYVWQLFYCFGFISVIFNINNVIKSQFIFLSSFYCFHTLYDNINALPSLPNFPHNLLCTNNTFHIFKSQIFISSSKHNIFFPWPDDWLSKLEANKQYLHYHDCEHVE